jgi:hypothetical protein
MGEGAGTVPAAPAPWLRSDGSGLSQRRVTAQVVGGCVFARRRPIHGAM